MTLESNTDSLFTSGLNHTYDQETWSDIRLIHESDSGWSVVYSGLFRGRRVAIKGLKPEFRSSQFHKNILHKEFEVASGLNHQNIATALWMEDVPEIGEAILMEYIDGITLTDYIASNPTIGSKHILDIIEQICSAVGYMHSRQTIHCDLKPSNVMITASGFVKLIDFGMSRGSGFEKLDFPGGTQGFTAPENFHSDSKATVAVDIFSIGKILELMDRKRGFKKIWKECLSSDSEKRPASATEVSERLRLLYESKKQRKIQFAEIGFVVVLAILVGSIFLKRQYLIGSDRTDEPTISISDTNSSKPNEELHGDSFQPKYTEGKKEMPITSEPSVSTEKMGVIAEETVADDRSFQEQLSEKFKQVAGKRFKEHLMLIDTMTTVRSNELQSVEHWRWLAKQDMRKWLEEKLAPDHVRIDEEMKDVERYIDEYANFSHRRGIEWSHRVDAAKRCPELAGWTNKYAFYEGIDLLVVRKLGEDGKWSEERIHVPIDRSDPEATMKIKHEYMQKAMED